MDNETVLGNKFSALNVNAASFVPNVNAAEFVPTFFRAEPTSQAQSSVESPVMDTTGTSICS